MLKDCGLMGFFQNKKRKLNNESFGEEISSYYFGLTRLIEPKVNFDEDKVKKCMEIAEDHLTDAFYVRLFQNEEDENKDLGKNCAHYKLHLSIFSLAKRSIQNFKRQFDHYIGLDLLCWRPS